MALLNQTRDDEWYTEDLRFCVHRGALDSRYLVRDGKTNETWWLDSRADVEAHLQALKEIGVWKSEPKPKPRS